MNHPESAWDFIANIFGNTDVGESSCRNPWGVSNSMLPDPQPEFMTSCSWQYLSDSVSVGGAPVEDLHHFQNTQLPAEISVEAAVEQESSQRKRNSRELDNSKCLGEENCKRKQIEKPKPKRRAEVHTMSERKRRERIRGKIRALQELTPNCTKDDKASILDDVIKYIKSLKLQVEMMSMGLGRGGLLQVPWPYMSEAGIQSSPVTPFIQMSPGMCFVYSSSQSQFLMPTPSPLSTCFQLQSPYPGTPLMYGGNSGTRNVPLPQLQMPFIHPQLPPTNTVLPPNPVFNHSSQTQSQGQGEIFTAQHMPTTPIVCHQLPITSQLQDSRRKPQT